MRGLKRFSLILNTAHKLFFFVFELEVRDLILGVERFLERRERSALALAPERLCKGSCKAPRLRFAERDAWSVSSSRLSLMAQPVVDGGCGNCGLPARGGDLI